MTDEITNLVSQVIRSARKGHRRVVAIAGAPASGKSTLAGTLTQSLNNVGCASQLVPMDGFHLHNPLLVARGVLNRKGAPETFDAGGLLRLVQELASDRPVYHPVFDRAKNISIAGAGYIGPECDTVVIEGNYLLMDAPIWRDMIPFWDLSIILDVAEDVLQSRLVQRWLDHGLSAEQAQASAEENDIPNARLVIKTATKPDLYI